MDPLRRGGRNGSVVLVAPSTVRHDTSPDELTGGPGQDWFWVTAPADATIGLDPATEVVN